MVGSSVARMAAVGVVAGVLVAGASGAARAAHSGLPTAPAGAVLLHHHSRAGITAAEYRVKGLTPKAVTRHYRKAYRARGFSVRSAQPARAYSYLYLKNGDVYAFVGAGRAGNGRVRYEICQGTSGTQVDVCA